jgi:hypothetical protein
LPTPAFIGFGKALSLNRTLTTFLMPSTISTHRFDDGLVDNGCFALGAWPRQ